MKGKNEKFYSAHVNYGYTLEKLADLLDIHWTTVNRAVHKSGR